MFAGVNVCMVRGLMADGGQNIVDESRKDLKGCV